MSESGRPLTDGQIDNIEKTLRLTKTMSNAKIDAYVATLRRTRAIPQPKPTIGNQSSSNDPSFRTRKTGSVNQVGKKFPTASRAKRVSDILRADEHVEVEGDERIDPDVLIADLRPKANNFCDNCGYQFHVGESGIKSLETGDILCKLCARHVKPQDVPLENIGPDATKGYAGVDGDQCVDPSCGSRRRSLCGHGYCYQHRLTNDCGCRREPTEKNPLNGVLG